MKISNHTLFALCIVAAVGTTAYLLHKASHKTVVAAKETKSQRLARSIAGRFEQEFLMTRDPATNTVPQYRLQEAYRIAQAKRAQMAQAERAIPVYWEERGPNNVGGRTRGLIFDANDPTGRTVWAAGVSGGLWRTTNIDAALPTWTQADDFFDYLNITTLAQDPSNPNRMYFGTGEQGFANGIERGFGIWRSTNGGATWEALPATSGNSDFFNVNKIVVDGNGDLYVGTTGGFFRSTDGGDSFQQLFGGTGSAQDVEVSASGQIFVGRNGGGVFQLQGNALVELNSPSFPAVFSRVEIACAPGNAQVIYAAFEATDGTCAAVCVSTDGGATWNATATTPGVGDICWYCFILAVDPNDINRIWLGAQSLVHSTDGGATWIPYPPIHADHHAIVYRTGNSNEMVFGNDGGVYRCTNGANAAPAITPKNNSYNVTQFYANAMHPTAGSNYLLGGTQDNGTPQFTGGGLVNTAEAPGTSGDGGFCFIDQDDPNIQIASSQRQYFYVSNNGGAFFANITPLNNSALFITPADYDDAADILYFSDAGNRLGRMSGVGAANTVTIENLTEMNGGQASALTVSPNTANRVYVGTTNGALLRIDDAHQNGAVIVEDLNSPIADYISCILVEEGNENHIIITQSNYGTNSVWETTDGGDNWVDIDNDLPDMPVRWAMFHPFDHDKLLLATELGVWSTDDLDGVNTQWWPTSNFGLANVRVDMLQYRASDHMVVAATHGRGMYETDYFNLLTTCVPSLNIAGAVAPGIYMAEDFIVSNGVINAGRKVIYHAGDHIQLQPGFQARRGSNFWALIEECGITPAIADRQRNTTLSPVTALSLQCRPNPVVQRLQIEYDIPNDGQLTLCVRDLQGRLIEMLVANESRRAGRYQLELDAGNYQAGIYLLCIQTERHAQSERFLVVR
ncbi:MAG: T9SS type A sorting domain-containing protein [Saprospiraceae bacterium]|nr:T9SS type A sorting domain-containing protein [Saprospiraceae bacterium]